MIRLVSYMLLFMLVSCASKKNIEFLDSNRDDLNRESLSRKELSSKEKDFSKNLLSSCYKNSNYDVKTSSRKKLDILKESFFYWSSIGSCYLHQDQPQKALFFYKIALSKVKTKAQKAIYFNNLGVYYTKVNRLNLAIEIFFDSIENNKSYKTPHMNLAMIYTQFGLNKKARNQLSYFRGSKDPHILYLRKIINSEKDIVNFFPGYLTEEEKKDTLDKITQN